MAPSHCCWGGCVHFELLFLQMVSGATSNWRIPYWRLLRNMDWLQNVILGFQACLQPINLLYCFIGVFIGTLIGVLPGIGPIGTMAILLPATFRVPPLSAIIMLAGIYYGAQYGGS